MELSKPQDPRHIRFKLALPTVLLVLVVLLSQISYDVSAIQRGMPLIAGGLIFYWGLFRPDLVPFAVCLGVGLLQDILSGVPLGLHGLGYILLRQVASSRRQYLHARPFHVVWLFFIAAFAFWALIEGFVMSALGYPFGSAPIARFVATVLVFPLVYSFAGRFHHRYLRQGV